MFMELSTLSKVLSCSVDPQKSCCNFPITNYWFKFEISICGSFWDTPCSAKHWSVESWISTLQWCLISIITVLHIQKWPGYFWVNCLYWERNGVAPWPNMAGKSEKNATVQLYCKWELATYWYMYMYMCTYLAYIECSGDSEFKTAPGKMFCCHIEMMLISILTAH